MTRAASKTTGVLDYLQSSLPRQTLLQLYTEETRGRFVCRAVLQRALSHVAQQVVIRLSATGGAFATKDVQIWVRSKKHPEKILRELHQWAIIHDEYSQVVRLTDQFYKAIQTSICSLDTSPWTAITPQQIEALEQEERVSSEVVTTDDLERYTNTQWDAVLHFLVGTVGQTEPPTAVVQFLLQTGLMQADPDFRGDEDDAPLVITQTGYDFMLQDNHQQVWHFVVQYLQSLESHEKGPKLIREALLLLICLSFARVGECFLASSLNKHARIMVKDLALFGLLYTRKIGKATLVYPTRVAMQLVGSDEDANASALWSLSSKALDSALAHPKPHDSTHLAIIVQTNFQLCAYTTSELHVSMLGLFCDVQTIRRLPNIVFMTITRDSVKSAFALGIQARQILRFLEKHAHPKLRTTNASPVPSNVVDQIWLWDRERHRLQWTEVYQHQCLMPGEFRAVQQYAMDHHAHAWSSERRQEIFINYKHVERVQAFVRQWRAQAASRNN